MDLHNSTNINQLHAGLLIEELIRAGVDAFFLSPGSRNTPLTLAAAAHPAAECTIHFDERGTAFCALGHALATGRPAALICTSGSATANWWPAVVEASQSRIPLLLLTADRPPELLDCGANQAIDQMHLFRPYVRHDAVLQLSDSGLPPEYILTTVDQAVHSALHPPAGPVHLDCMFREPLEPSPGPMPDPEKHLAPLTGWMAAETPYTTWHRPEIRLAESDEHTLITELPLVRKGLLVVGRLDRDEDREAVRDLIPALEWPVFADITSGLRTGAASGYEISAYDLLLQAESFRRHCAPGCVLHIGGSLTSKRLQQHLATLNTEYIMIADHPRRHDPGHHVNRRYQSDIAAFCAWLRPAIAVHESSNWGSSLFDLAKMTQLMIDESTASGDLNEVNVARLLTRRRPQNALLYAGNSMPVRAFDMYAAPDSAPGPVIANRGASGIDGNVATIAGLARASHRPVIALIGDLALLHDLNSLALIRELESPAVLVVINNNGGGIFSFLPIASYPDHFERFFTTPHNMDFSAAAAQFSIEYAAPGAMDHFEADLKKALGKNSATLIEVRVDRNENFRAHKEIQDSIRRLAEEKLNR